MSQEHSNITAAIQTLEASINHAKSDFIKSYLNVLLDASKIYLKQGNNIKDSIEMATSFMWAIHQSSQSIIPQLSEKFTVPQNVINELESLYSQLDPTHSSSPS